MKKIGSDLVRTERFGAAIPLASPQGGVAERSIKCRAASADRREAQARQRAASREAGVVFRWMRRKTTPAAQLRESF